MKIYEEMDKYTNKPNWLIEFIATIVLIVFVLEFFYLEIKFLIGLF